MANEAEEIAFRDVNNEVMLRLLTEEIRALRALLLKARCRDGECISCHQFAFDSGAGYESHKPDCEWARVMGV